MTQNVAARASEKRNSTRLAIHNLVPAIAIKRSLFSAGWEFWLYHCSGQLLLLLFHLVFFFLVSPDVVLVANIVATAVWTAGLFMSGLVLRGQYLERQWQSQNIVKVLFKSLGVSLLLSLLAVLLMAAVTFVFFFQDLVDYIALEKIDMSMWKFATRFILTNWFQTLFYLVSWMALYIAITNVRRAKRTEMDNLRLQNSLKEAKLSSLSNQLNPHFLFNALNNIRFMISENGEHAEGMVMSLSEVLRYSLESSKQDKVMLKKELEVIERYIDLVRVQFEDRLRFEMDIAPGLHHYQLPPMILQMLIENAVKHGLERIQEGGVIKVSVEEQGQNLLLVVCNDAPDSKNNEHGNTGIGLNNISQRLTLLYGNKATLDTTFTDGLFCASISLPKESI